MAFWHCSQGTPKPLKPSQAHPSLAALWSRHGPSPSLNLLFGDSLPIAVFCLALLLSEALCIYFGDGHSFLHSVLEELTCVSLGTGEGECLALPISCHCDWLTAGQ